MFAHKPQSTCRCKSDRGNYYEVPWQGSSTSAPTKVPKTALQLRVVNVAQFANNGTLIEMTDPIELPPELQRVADLLSEQPPAVRDLFRFALVLAMVDDEKARVIGTRVENGQEWLTIKTTAGEVFEILRPPISEEVEAELMRQVRAIVHEDSGE